MGERNKQCPPDWAYLGWLAGADLCRDSQGLQDALLRDIVTGGRLGEMQQHFVTTCDSRQVIRVPWEIACTLHSKRESSPAG
jgi:hypothetical protein